VDLEKLALKALAFRGLALRGLALKAGFEGLALKGWL
jgi:hypothetical protein